MLVSSAISICRWLPALASAALLGDDGADPVHQIGQVVIEFELGGGHAILAVGGASRVGVRS
jgi:hypothetical protein